MPGAAGGTASAELRFAQEARIDAVINYSAINASPEAVRTYLDEAQRRGVRVVLSLKDLLGDRDLDEEPENQALHQQYGATTTRQVAGVIKQYDGHPAVWGYFISDELPADPQGEAGTATWLGPLKARYRQVTRLSRKPVMVSMYWGENREAFLYDVHGAASGHLMMDYYPFPDETVHGGRRQTYGPIADLATTGSTMRRVAGAQSWSAIQAFPWEREPGTAKQFGFNGQLAPSVGDMAHMAQLALRGDGTGPGAQNLAFFSYDYAAQTPGQLERVKQAARRIRQLPEWRGTA
jgi:hypothetical protein